MAKGRRRKQRRSIPIAPILGAGAIFCGAIAVMILRNKQQPNDSIAWAQEFWQTPPIMPRPGAKGLFEETDLPIERAAIIYG